jgi:hypothetical protein
MWCRRTWSLDFGMIGEMWARIGLDGRKSRVDDGKEEDILLVIWPGFFAAWSCRGLSN